MIEQADHRPDPMMCSGDVAVGGVAVGTDAPPVPRRRRGASMVTPKRASAAALAVVIAVAAYVAISLHRRGHTTGDDFALYLRQAQSLFEGNIGQVISDNRLLWANSTGVTPQMYPWGFAVILAPFVRVFGLDYDRLKLVEVACLCLWLVVFHGIVRRRTDRAVALAVTAVFATAPIYLLHTDQLLTEFPHMLAVAVVIWWLDRVILQHRLPRAPTTDLVVLGLLMMVAYNVRRESIVFLAVIAATQFVDVLGERSNAVDRGQPSPWRRGRNPLGALPWKTLSIPYLSFAAGCAIAQFMLPSTLVPDNGNSRSFITTRLFNLNEPGSCPNPRNLSPAPRNCGNYPWHLLQQLGLTEKPVFGLIIICMALAGAAIVVRQVAAPERPARGADVHDDARDRHALPDGGPLLLPGDPADRAVRRDPARDGRPRDRRHHQCQVGEPPSVTSSPPPSPRSCGSSQSTSGRSRRRSTQPTATTTAATCRADRRIPRSRARSRWCSTTPGPTTSSSSGGPGP